MKSIKRLFAAGAALAMVATMGLGSVSAADNVSNQASFTLEGGGLNIVEMGDGALSFGNQSIADLYTNGSLTLDGFLPTYEIQYFSGTGEAIVMNLSGSTLTGPSGEVATFGNYNVDIVGDGSEFPADMTGLAVDSQIAPGTSIELGSYAAGFGAGISQVSPIGFGLTLDQAAWEGSGMAIEAGTYTGSVTASVAVDVTP